VRIRAIARAVIGTSLVGVLVASPGVVYHHGVGALRLADPAPGCNPDCRWNSSVLPRKFSGLALADHRAAALAPSKGRLIR
jgi:hypothetical protein